MTQPSDQELEKYARLILEIGLNLQAGQRLAIEAPIETAGLVRKVAAQAYQLGARLVNVVWLDDQIRLDRFRYAPRDSFEEYPAWKAKILGEYAENGDAVLRIHAEDPDLLRDQDPRLVTTWQQTRLKHRKALSDVVTRDGTNWCIASVPIPSWAAKIFPDLSAEHQMQKLWETIFMVTRTNQPAPIALWKEHIRQLKARSRWLSERRFMELHYRAPGTDLTIGLPEGHHWQSGSIITKNGIEFTPNLPTEEVFTIPHKARVEGVVSSSKPLSYAGNLIEDFRLRFENGRVVEYSAGKGEETLRGLLETDEGSHRLGEVALVPHGSPISQSGVFFYNTLFDENAACHLALGRGVRTCLAGGSQMTQEQYEAAGGNDSLLHVDFMVGSDQLDIDGLLADGSQQAVMRKGEWAVEV
jgi:aminopeptidase